MAKTTWPVKPSSDSDNDEGFVVDQTNGTVYTGEGCWGAPLRANDDDKSWTRSSGSFNQFKLIFVETSKIELRTIDVNNAVSVGEVSNTDPFTLPTGLNVFTPSTGAVVTITNPADTSSCPEVNTPCDDGNPATVFSIEDGSCNCVGLDESLVEEYTVEVNTGSDDAEEDVSTTVVNTTSTDLELVLDSSNQIIGVRFDSVEIPDSAVILRAYIQFTSDEYNSFVDPTNLIIDGELSPNSSTFDNSTNKISTRTKTSAANTVLWSDIKRWGSNGVAGFYERTPSLVNIINEIIAQPGWVYGNSMSFIISGSGKRVAGSFNGNRPPSLRIIYLHNRPITNATLGSQGACDPMTDTYTQDITLTYNNPPATGNLNVNGQLFAIGTSPQTITLSGLSSDGFEVDLSAFFTDDATNIYNENSFFEAPSKCSLGNIPDNEPNDNLNLALLTEATLSGSVSGGRGAPEDILYNPAISNYHVITAFNEYGVSFNENLGTPDVDSGFKWQVNWSNVKYINYITFGGTYPNQPQPNTMWRISYRLDGNWIILDEGQGGWIDSGIYEWGGATQNPIEADALRVQLYSDGVNDVISIHLRGRGGTSSNTGSDSSTTPKGTLIQYLSPGNSCGVTIPSGTTIYCDGSWIYSDEPDDSTGTMNAIIADGTYTIDIDKTVEVNDLEIAIGATLIMKEGASLTVNGNLINNGNLELESISTKYSSLIVDGTSNGNVSYKRHVNAFNGSTGNDLISSPFTGETFSDFATANPNLFENPTNTVQKLFGPFNEPLGSYQTYLTTTNASTTLDKGIGYRAARNAALDGVNGTTLTFSGSIETNGFLPITESTTSFSGWNLIGNPYPSYIDFDTFFNLNKTQLDTNVYQAIYGYDGDASNGWTILNNLSTGQLIAPGQGFFVKTKPGGGIISFTPAMRVIGASDDFILGRNTNNGSNEGYIKLGLSNNISDISNTTIHFNNNASLGLDPGYDAALFGGNAPNFSIYSNLVQDNTGVSMAIQALGTIDINNITIPLGIHASQGQEVTVSITESTISSSTEVYLEDRLINTFTLLTNQDYTFTALSNISGVGRFYISLQATELSTLEQTLEDLSIYINSAERVIVIDGQLKTNTNFKLYDINGRIMKSKALDVTNTIQTIDVSALSTGIYIIELISNVNEKRIQKLIIE